MGRECRNRPWRESSIRFTAWKTTVIAPAVESAWVWPSLEGRSNCTKGRFAPGTQIRGCWLRSACLTEFRNRRTQGVQQKNCVDRKAQIAHADLEPTPGVLFRVREHAHRDIVRFGAPDYPLGRLEYLRMGSFSGDAEAL